MIRRAGMVVPRDVLIEDGWGKETDVSDANLYFFMRSLRSKITQPGEAELLHTVRGVGYSIRSESC
jgi:DNA-binding response OmpR family regulator